MRNDVDGDRAGFRIRNEAGRAERYGKVERLMRVARRDGNRGAGKSELRGSDWQARGYHASERRGRIESRRGVIRGDSKNRNVSRTRGGEGVFRLGRTEFHVGIRDGNVEA